MEEKEDISTLALHALARRERRLLAGATSSWAVFLSSSLTSVLQLLSAWVVCLALLAPGKASHPRHKRLAPRDEASDPAVSHAVVLQHQHPDQLHCSGS